MDGINQKLPFFSFSTVFDKTVSEILSNINNLNLPKAEYQIKGLSNLNILLNIHNVPVIKVRRSENFLQPFSRHILVNLKMKKKINLNMNECLLFLFYYKSPLNLKEMLKKNDSRNLNYNLRNSNNLIEPMAKWKCEINVELVVKFFQITILIEYKIFRQNKI
ncbi:hypothetical protein BpHYR1_026182 [Brachionus plicatilis]|uniref:Uncharacterized protein n=1 Tax=Brachionus plicatilis TaxID=10195 RepID=A0A3M7T911_BRAPC|nr:hypothetical protein BpHYR1_026182 [Brachionus plicatilis]